jgi:LacI family transcriptional regulator
MMDKLIELDDPQVSLYEQVAGDLKERINRYEFGSHGRMPNFKQLAKSYNVSISTIKKAMQILTDERIVVARVGKGTFANLKNGDRNGRTGDTGNQVGLMIRDLDGPYFSGIYQGLKDTARELRKSFLLTVSLDDYHNEETVFKTLVEQTSGILATTRRKSLYGISTFNRMVELNFPFVMLHDLYDNPGYSVDVNNYEGGRLAAAQLMSRKLKKYCVAVGETGFRADDMRLKGFVDGLREAGVNVDEDCLILRYSFGTEATAFDEGYKIGRTLDIAGLGLQGFFMFNDLIAMGFQKAVLERGLSIPEDIAVIGFDNIDRCSEARVPLTTINVPRNEIGEKALKLLTEMMSTEKGWKSERILLEPKLVKRQSA